MREPIMNIKVLSTVLVYGFLLIPSINAMKANIKNSLSNKDERNILSNHVTALAHIELSYDLTNEKNRRLTVNKYNDTLAVKTKKEILNLEIACLLTGYRDVVCLFSDLKHSYDGGLDRFLKKYIEIFTPIYALDLQCKNEHGKTDSSGLILYTNSGAKNAFLLAKFLLEVNINPDKTNNYLMGKLLGYSEEDNEFFAQINAFLTFTPEGRWFANQGIRAYNFVNWSFEQKQAFESFVACEWFDVNSFSDLANRIKPQFLVDFKKDKESANAWIEANNSKDIDLLKSEVNQLLKQLQ
jgi:hypothetical protein